MKKSIVPVKILLRMIFLLIIIVVLMSIQIQKVSWVILVYLLTGMIIGFIMQGISIRYFRKHLFSPIFNFCLAYFLVLILFGRDFLISDPYPLWGLVLPIGYLFSMIITIKIFEKISKIKEPTLEQIQEYVDRK